MFALFRLIRDRCYGTYNKGTGPTPYANSLHSILNNRPAPRELGDLSTATRQPRLYALNRDREDSFSNSAQGHVGHVHQVYTPKTVFTAGCLFPLSLYRISGQVLPATPSVILTVADRSSC